jgi:hypothetical protein
MTRFDEIYNSIMEDMIAGPGGAFGDLGGEEHGGDVGNSDWYAPGDARVPKIIGAKEKHKKSCKKHKKGKNKKHDGNVIDSVFSGNVPVARRVFPNM